MDDILFQLVRFVLLLLVAVHLYFAVSAECLGIMNVEKPIRTLCHFNTAIASLISMLLLGKTSKMWTSLAIITTIQHCIFYAFFLFTGDAFYLGKRLLLLVWLPSVLGLVVGLHYPKG
ncbi:hypothetical protein XU18_0206 [Perkinsela sp. CCAP 1560/4]|nr:hypothetical protein XU18_0206 [Perkinsela sp. CCAP 1560/4]|eukprot:KNH09521.1 hypothetical protein XU18_0206 [Perkinsela sp. CCAP 1560/4]